MNNSTSKVALLGFIVLSGIHQEVQALNTPQKIFLGCIIGVPTCIVGYYAWDYYTLWKRTPEEVINDATAAMQSYTEEYQQELTELAAHKATFKEDMLTIALEKNSEAEFPLVVYENHLRDNLNNLNKRHLSWLNHHAKRIKEIMASNCVYTQTANKNLLEKLMSTAQQLDTFIQQLHKIRMAIMTSSNYHNELMTQKLDSIGQSVSSMNTNMTLHNIHHDFRRN